MARDEKRVQLKTVDDEGSREPEVVRLYNREIEPVRKAEPPIRLGAAESREGPRRLEVAARDELELRTHQPGVESLIEPEACLVVQDEETWGGTPESRRPLPWGWFALIGMAVAAAVIWSLANLRESEAQAQSIRQETRSTLVRDEIEETEARQLIERIEKTLRIYFDTASVDMLARLVRHRQRVMPLMREHYAQQPLTRTPLRSVRALQPLTLDNRGNFWMASVMLSDGRLENLVIEIDPNGVPLIDWETLVCYQPMGWDEFALKRPVGRSMAFRVRAERDFFHSHEFSDSEKWHCYRLTAPGGEETLFGYAAVGSKPAHALADLLEHNRAGLQNVILELAIPHGLKSRRGVVIEKFLSPRWLYVDPPDSGS